MDKINGFYELVKLCKGGLSLNMPAFDASANDKLVSIPWNVQKVRIPRIYALGIFTDATLQSMYEKGYFRIEPAAEFEKDVASIFAPVEDKVEVIADETIMNYLVKGNRAAIKKLIEDNDVNRLNTISLAREHISEIPTSMVRDLEKILSVELIIENDIDE